MDLRLKIAVINKYNIREELYKLLEDIDSYFVGEDGEEHLLKEAREEGFSSNLDYSLEVAKRKHKDDLNKVIEEVIFSATSTWGSDYEEWEKEVVKVGENYVVSLSVVSNY